MNCVWKPCHVHRRPSYFYVPNKNWIRLFLWKYILTCSFLFSKDARTSDGISHFFFFFWSHHFNSVSLPRELSSFTQFHEHSNDLTWSKIVSLCVVSIGFPESLHKKHPRTSPLNVLFHFMITAQSHHLLRSSCTVRGSKLNQLSDYPDWGISWFPSVPTSILLDSITITLLRIISNSLIHTLVLPFDFIQLMQLKKHC
jgi:hypothetical protein